MTFKPSRHIIKPAYLVTSHTSAQNSPDSSGTRMTLDGSTLNYTPHPDAQHVVYEIAFSAQRLGDWTFQTLQLQVSTNGGSTYSDVTDRTISTFGHSNVVEQSYRWFHHRRYIFDAWSGERHYRLQIGANTAGRTCKYGALTQFDGTSQTVYVNTSLIMHSLL